MKIYILGAGSSYDYMPLGSELRQMLLYESFPQSIKERMADYQQLERCFRQIIKIATSKNSGFSGPFSRSELDNFQRDFLSSGTSTIDVFLSSEKGKDYESIGKFLIYTFISIFLNKKRLAGINPTDDWISLFLDLEISHNYRDFLASETKFYTFNYDTIFPNRLRDHLAAYGVSNTDIDKFIDKSIHHIYGKVDFHISDSIIRSNIDTTPVQNWQKLVSKISSESQDLKLIRYEVIDVVLDTSEVSAKGSITSSPLPIPMGRQTFSLGYGFDKYNNALLFSDSDYLTFMTSFYYTSIGLDAEAINLITENISSAKYLTEGNCYQTLKAYLPRDFFPKKS